MRHALVAREFQNAIRFLRGLFVMICRILFSLLLLGQKALRSVAAKMACASRGTIASCGLNPSDAPRKSSLHSALVRLFSSGGISAILAPAMTDPLSTKGLATLAFSHGDARPAAQESVKAVWLIRIRWTALVVYALVSAVAVKLLDLPVDMAVAGTLVLLGIASNVALMAVMRFRPRRSAVASGVAISFDVLLVAALLYLYGGYTNPFSMVFLVYVTLAAFCLNARWTWWTFGLSSALFVLLFFFHIPLEQLSMHAHHGGTAGFSLHLHGMLVAFFVIGSLISFFLTRLSNELAMQSEQLAVLNEREQERKRLASLATLTGGAAHELATPIATMVLIADDLKRALAGRADLSGDVEAMEAELRRCEEVLNRMRSQSSELVGEVPTAAAVSAVVQEVRGSLRGDGQVEFVLGDAGHLSLRTLRRSLVSSLSALIRNGVQASAPNGLVRVKAAVVPGGVEFVVKDNGVGMSRDTLDRAGDPFFTTKDPGQGLGLGLFLVKSFASQVGGALSLSSSLGQGTEARLFVPQEAVL